MSAEALRLRLVDLAATGRGESRRSELLPPAIDGSTPSAEAGGIRRLFACTDEAALERFAQARGETFPVRVPAYGAQLPTSSLSGRNDGP
ncbi:hypothetical protein ACFV3E_31350 [Streptomyces sp. NPDC059718]